MAYNIIMPESNCKNRNQEESIMHYSFRGIRPDDLHGRRALRNPERGYRTEMYFSTIPGEVAGMCSCHFKQLKLDGRSETPVYQNIDVPGVPHLIRGNRLDGVEFSHCQWEDELDYFAYDGVTVMQSYCFLMNYGFGAGRPLPAEKLADIEQFLLRLRANRVKTLLRFAYELSPTLSGPTSDIIFRHIEQLRPLLRKYMDVIYVLQCGFVGKFGEWHHSYHKLQNDLSFRKELFQTVLELLPADRCTMVRYPRLKMEVFGDTPLSAERAFTNIPEARIGHFCDGFLAGPTCGGSWYGVRGETEKAFAASESKYLPQDGELFWRDIAGAALPDASVKELALHHYDTLGFVHGNREFEGTDGYSIDVWKRVPVDPMFLIDNNLPMSNGYFESETGKHIWRSYYEYIRDHLGYRIELQSADLQIENGRLRGNVKLVNRGFSAPVNPRPVFLAVGNLRIPLSCDVRHWFSLEEQTLSFDFELPSPGKYEIGLWLPDASENLRGIPEYAIRCANPLEFRDGVNWFGSTIEI